MLTAAASKNRQTADRSPSPSPTKPGENFAKTPTGKTKVQTHGPSNLEKIACLRQQYRKNRHRAGQGPNPWATKPGENCTLTAAASKNRQRADRSPSPWPTNPGGNFAKPPTGRPRSKTMGHQTWRKLHAYGSSIEKTATGQTKVQTHGPPSLEKIARLRQQWRRDRQPADQSPSSISQLTCFKMKTVHCSAKAVHTGAKPRPRGFSPKVEP